MDAAKLWSFQIAKAIDISFQELFKAARHRTGLSARALSIACDLSPSYVSKIESGEIKPSISAFVRLMEKMECSEPELLLLIGKLR